MANLEKNCSYLLAESINSKLDLSSAFLAFMNESCPIPIAFKQQRIIQFYRNYSDSGVNVVRFMFMDNTDEADVLLAEKYELNFKNIKVSRCRIYFSSRCNSDMAATAYFVIMAMSSDQITISNQSIYKFCSEMFRHFGKTLTPINEKDFWNEKLDIIRREKIQRLLALKDANSSNDIKTIEQLSNRIRSLLSNTWSYWDCYYCPNDNLLRLLIQSGDKLELIHYFYKEKINYLMANQKDGLPYHQSRE